VPTFDPDLRALGRRVRSRRLGLYLAQQTLARECRMSVGVLHDVEDGLREPSASMLHRLALALNLSMDELWRGDTRRPRADAPAHPSTPAHITTPAHEDARP
jgi:transcriptional regulator with XRE-family HTH domain